MEGKGKEKNGVNVEGKGKKGSGRKEEANEKGHGM